MSGAEKLLCVGMLLLIPLGAGAVYRQGRRYDRNLFALDPKLVSSLKRTTPPPAAPGTEPGEDAAGATPPAAGAAIGVPGAPGFAVPGMPPGTPGTLPALPGTPASALPPAAVGAAAAPGALAPGGAPALFGASFGDPQWALSGRVERFRADNLYEKVDGRSEHYLKYNAIGLQAATYADRRDAGRFMDVLVFDMSKPTNAFGVFTAERPEGAPAIPLGDQGYRAETSYFFTRGRYYVQVVPSGRGKLLQDAGLKLARALDAALGGATTPAVAAAVPPPVRPGPAPQPAPPAPRAGAAAGAPRPAPKKPAAPDFSAPAVMLALFPKADQVPSSGQYVPQDALSLDFLKETYTARYKVGDKEYTLFLTKRDTEAQTQALAAQYVDFWKSFGKLVDQRAQDKMQFFIGDVSGLADAVFQAGPFLGGVNAAGDRAVAETLSLRLLRAVAAAAPNLLPEPARKLEQWPSPEQNQ